MSALFRKLEKYLAATWAIVILVASLMPGDNISIDSNMLFPHADKVVHFFMYFILQLLFMRHIRRDMKGKKQVIIFILVVGYGFLIELIQGLFLVDRFFENYDIIANITGALMGILFFNRINS